MAKESSASRLGWAATIVILFSSIPVSLTSTAVSPVLPKMLADFADTPDAAVLVKQMIGLATTSMAIGCLFGGWLANRFNHRSSLIISYSIYVVAGTLGFVLTDLYALLASRVVVGLAASALSTVALVALSDRAEGNRRNAMLGALVSISMFGAVVTYPAAGFLGNVDWRLVFLLYLIPLPVAVACFFMPRTTVERVPPEQNGSKAPFSIPYRVLFLGLMTGMISLMPAIYVPFRFHDIGIEDSGLISISLMVVTIMGSAVSATYGYVRRKLDIYQSLAVSLGMTACGMAIVALAPTLTLIMAGAFILGCGIGHIAPNVFALTMQLPAHERARAIGWVKAIKYVAPGIAVFMLEPIDRTFGTHATLTCVAAISLAMMAYVLIDRAPLRDQAKLAADQAKQAAA